jgi:pimeloyl-ACP methyl ester carboxylesterase
METVLNSNPSIRRMIVATYLLVHGAWHSGRSWDRVVPLLEAAGHRVLAPSLTGYGDKAHLLGPEVGLDTHIADVVTLISEEGLADVVLVGHSYAGAVITAAANEVPDRVAHLVYVDSTAPRDGETAVDALPGLQDVIDLAAKSETPWLIPPLPAELFGVTDPADLAWLSPMLSAHPVRCLQQPTRLDNPAVHAIRRTHIRCSATNAEGITLPPVPPPTRVWELSAGHDCMVTAPAELSELLLRISRTHSVQITAPSSPASLDSTG